jgi:hypothetical protein
MRITARMDGEIVYLGDLLHIDGPIASAVYQDLDADARGAIPPLDGAEWPLDLDLPLSRWLVPYDVGVHGPVDARLLADGAVWGWCASAADDEAWLRRGKREYRKKPDLARMSRYTDAKSAHLSSGHMKAYDLAFPTVLAAQVVWHAIGDVDKVRALLQRHIYAIGKKRGTGAGRVREWVVESEDLDRSVMVDGVLARRMPAGSAPGSPRFGSIRPPYHSNSRSLQAVEP